MFCVIYHLIHIGRITEIKPELKNEEQTICCLVPVYAEKVDLVVNNIKSLCNQDLPENTKIMILLICDGLVVGRHNKNPLFEELDKLVTYEDDTKYEELYTSWKTLTDNTLFYKKGEIYGKPIILAHKSKNCGKKDSLIVGEQLIEKIDTMEDLKNKYNIIAPKYIYHTDSDTVADSKCLRNLLETFQTNKDIDGVSGMVRAYYNDDNTSTFWRLYEKMFYIMQDFQYFFSLTLRRMTESELQTTTCLPGCVNMIKVNDKSRKAIEEYADLPNKETNFLEAVTRMQGTDRRYTTLLLKHGAKLQMNWRATVYTEPPLGAKAFINQRRRWSSNAFFNSFILFILPDLPLYIRISTIVDITRLFSTIFRTVSYTWFWIYFGRVEFEVYLILLFFVVVPYIYILSWAFFILSDWKKIWFGFLLNKLLMPVLSVLTITKMFLTASNFAWGGFVAKVEDIVEDIEILVVDMKEDIKEECVELGIISEEEGENEETNIAPYQMIYQ